MYYTIIAPTELTHNYAHLNTPYGPNQRIKNLFQQIQDARSFEVSGGQPYGDAMIVNVTLTLIFNTEFTPDDCFAWQARAVADTTWIQFKRDCTVAHREFNLTNWALYSNLVSTSLT
jgi:hypothetical protein